MIDLTEIQTFEHDILVIGAGGAALRCGAEILEKKPSTNVIALTKVSHPQKSHLSVDCIFGIAFITIPL